MQLADIGNLRRAKQVYHYLRETKQPERTAIFFGRRGLGKSKSLEAIQQASNAVYLYCLPTYTERSFITDILEAAGIQSDRHNKTDILKQVITYFGDTKRPLLLDDCDNIAYGSFPEIARAIHDRAGNLLILAGMERFAIKLSRWPQLIDRSHVLEFLPITLADTTALANNLTDITIEQKLVERIHQASEGKARLAVRSIGYICDWAAEHNLQVVTLKDWGDHSLLPNPEGNLC